LGPQVGGRAPGNSRSTAPREAGRGGLRPGGAPTWQGGRGGAGRLGGHVETAGRHRTGWHELEKGALGSRCTGRPSACSGLQDRWCAGRPVHCLYRRARQRGGEGQRGQAQGRPGSSVRRRAGELGTDRWSAGRSRPDGARREEEGGLRDRLGTRVSSGNEPREGARGLGRRGGRVSARAARLRGRRGATSRSGAENFPCAPV
jgi:hypothetical protein